MVVFEREVYEENRQVTLHNYWINVYESVDNNQDKYQPFIYNNNEKKKEI